MKTQRLLFFILVLSFFQTKITAQELVREGAQWNVYAVYWSFPPSAETISVKIEGDTLIDNVSYKKIYESRDSLNAYWTDIDTYIREDSTKKVYLLNENLGEILLYDFNLMLGDTFPIMNSDSWTDCNYLVVTEIDSVEILNGAIKKRWKLENHGSGPNNIFGITTYWYEDIGSSLGLMRFITEQYGCWEHYPYSLLCYYSDGEQVYGSSFEESCWLVPVRELSKADGISVYPNPTRGNVAIESKQADRNIGKVELYAATGQLLKTIIINSSTGTLNLNEYQNGAYYMLIEDSTGALRSVRLIKLE